jgi:hypothetical protein
MVSHIPGWINIPDIGEGRLADFGELVDFRKLAEQ